MDVIEERCEPPMKPSRRVHSGRETVKSRSSFTSASKSASVWSRRARSNATVTFSALASKAFANALSFIDSRNEEPSGSGKFAAARRMTGRNSFWAIFSTVPSEVFIGRGQGRQAVQTRYVLCEKRAISKSDRNACPQKEGERAPGVRKQARIGFCGGQMEKNKRK